MPTLKWTGCTLSSIPLWISRGRASNMVPGSGMRTLKPSLFPVMMGSMSGAELPAAWVTWINKSKNLFSLLSVYYPQSVSACAHLKGDIPQIHDAHAHVLQHGHLLSCTQTHRNVTSSAARLSEETSWALKGAVSDHRCWAETRTQPAGQWCRAAAGSRCPGDSSSVWW